MTTIKILRALRSFHAIADWYIAECSRMATDDHIHIHPELARQRSFRAFSNAFTASKRLRKQREARRLQAYVEAPDDSKVGWSLENATAPFDDTLWMVTREHDETAAGRQSADVRTLPPSAFLVFADARDSNAIATHTARKKSKKPAFDSAISFSGASDGGGSNAIIATHTARKQSRQRAFDSTMAFAGARDGRGSNAMIATHTTRKQSAQRVFDSRMADSRSQAQQRRSCRAFPASSATPPLRARQLN